MKCKYFLIANFSQGVQKRAKKEQWCKVCWVVRFEANQNEKDVENGGGENNRQ